VIEMVKKKTPNAGGDWKQTQADKTGFPDTQRDPGDNTQPQALYAHQFEETLKSPLDQPAKKTGVVDVTGWQRKEGQTVQERSAEIKTALKDIMDLVRIGDKEHIPAVQDFLNNSAQTILAMQRYLDKAHENELSPAQKKKLLNNLKGLIPDQYLDPDNSAAQLFADYKRRKDVGPEPKNPSERVARAAYLKIAEAISYHNGIGIVGRSQSERTLWAQDQLRTGLSTLKMLVLTNPYITALAQDITGTKYKAGKLAQALSAVKLSDLADRFKDGAPTNSITATEPPAPATPEP
jgi:hypothetical protein